MNKYVCVCVCVCVCVLARECVLCVCVESDYLGMCECVCTDLFMLMGHYAYTCVFVVEGASMHVCALSLTIYICIEEDTFH